MHSPILMFQSTQFDIVQDEDKLTNPGIFGRSLADWVAKELPAHGYQALGEVIPEDFAWCVPVAAADCELYVACANAEEGWQIYVFADCGLMARLIGRDPRAETVAGLYSAVRAILESAPGIQDLHTE
ncbi:hypothetical protein GTP41_09205 [Pseudoduganella sp. DS3]|uniref:Uncharacterized protein n=1 Tax=Pseudoduganella guangdongensis TaxID=2692179 RepID=A0A6N9HFP7_9BURK|nr:hypothetical protein [Pseudoduganella guangdongensis]MYN02276.1 hypothetical protein [Pseudoduganella guangdongensis]